MILIFVRLALDVGRHTESPDRGRDSQSDRPRSRPGEDQDQPEDLESEHGVEAGRTFLRHGLRDDRGRSGLDGPRFDGRDRRGDDSGGRRDLRLNARRDRGPQCGHADARVETLPRHSTQWITAMNPSGSGHRGRVAHRRQVTSRRHSGGSVRFPEGIEAIAHSGGAAIFGARAHPWRTRRPGRADSRSPWVSSRPVPSRSHAG